MRTRCGRGPPHKDDPLTIDEPPAQELDNEHTTCQSRDANDVFAWHFAQFAVSASQQSILDSAEVETDRRELLRFAESRFRGLIYAFESSFFDCWTAIGPRFQDAAKRSSHEGRRS